MDNSNQYLNLDDNVNAQQQYKDKADKYDELVLSVGYESCLKLMATNAVQIIKKKFTDNEKLKNIKILDLGCGTGLLVEEIFKLLGKDTVLTKDNFYGIDASDDMINEASKKNIYKEFHQQFVGGEETVPEKYVNFFDMVISSGFYNYLHNQCKEDGLDYIPKALKSKGSCIFTTGPPAFPGNDKFSAKWEEMEKKNTWKVENVIKSDFNYISDKNRLLIKKEDEKKGMNNLITHCQLLN